MTKFFTTGPFLLLLLFSLCGPAPAAVEKTAQIHRPLAAAPLDVAVSADGRRVFVLTEGGTVHIYSADGTLQGTMPVDGAADRLAVSPAADRIYLTSREGKTLQVATVDYVHDIDIAGSPFRGPDDAPVTVVVFSDFQCPYCAALAPQLSQLLANYPRQVKVVYKHFPLRNHRFALPAAVASMAAAAQGRFWPFHDRLFADSGRLSEGTILAAAQEVGLDIDRFKKDLGNLTLRAAVRRDVQQARELGVRGTPTVFVNGRLLKDRSPASFQAMIEKELAAVDGRPSTGSGGVQ